MNSSHLGQHGLKIHSWMSKQGVEHTSHETFKVLNHAGNIVCEFLDM